MEKQVNIITMSDVEITPVSWLWYPYIPNGKITLIQGDLGDGKTTFVLAIAALLTNGKPMPETNEKVKPQTVIYQTAEDGLADTIKPRLIEVGANCKRVVVIDESDEPLSLADNRIEQAIIKTKGMYRGLGSIDIAAAVRSILLVGRDKEHDNTRVMAHLKSSLAPEGTAIAFELDENGFRWVGKYDIMVEELLYGISSEREPTKESQAIILITELLRNGEMQSIDVYKRLEEHGISKRTAENAKSRIGVVSTDRSVDSASSCDKQTADDECNIEGTI